MRCPKCNAQLCPGQTTCTNCGRSMSASELSASRSFVPPSDSSSGGGVSTVLRVLAFIVLAIGIIGSFVLAFHFGYTEVTVGYYYSYTERQFSAIVFFSVLMAGTLSSSISAAVLYGLGSIVACLTDIRGYLRGLSDRQ